MGQNHRYGSDVTERTINEFVIRPAPISLTPRELGVDPAKVAEAEKPVDVRAWVRFPETAVHVEGRAIAWTPRAVWVEFTLVDGSTRRAWVWASAVERK